MCLSFTSRAWQTVSRLAVGFEMLPDPPSSKVAPRLVAVSPFLLTRNFHVMEVSPFFWPKLALGRTIGMQNRGQRYFHLLPPAPGHGLQCYRMEGRSAAASLGSWSGTCRAQKLALQPSTGWSLGVRWGERCWVPTTDLCALQFSWVPAL